MPLPRGGDERGTRDIMSFAHRRDYYAGGLMVLIGGGAAVIGGQYQMGGLTRMGPGFFPTALGVLLAVLGIIIAGTAAYTPASTANEAAPMHPDWRGWFCITAGAFLFIGLAGHGGLLPATFACVFVAAMGDRENTWKEAALLAAGITVFGTALFAYVLHIEIPIIGSM
jgi:hypothetical protein